MQKQARAAQGIDRRKDLVARDRQYLIIEAKAQAASAGDVVLRNTNCCW
jgi:hypothetical protein